MKSYFTYLNEIRAPYQDPACSVIATAFVLDMSVKDLIKKYKSYIHESSKDDPWVRDLSTTIGWFGLNKLEGAFLTIKKRDIETIVKAEGYTVKRVKFNDENNRPIHEFKNGLNVAKLDSKNSNNRYLIFAKNHVSAAAHGRIKEPNSLFGISLMSDKEVIEYSLQLYK